MVGANREGEIPDDLCVRKWDAWGFLDVSSAEVNRRG